VRRKKPWEKDDDDEVGGSAAATRTGAEGTSLNTEEQQDVEEIDVEQRKQTGEGVMKILQPGAVPDSGLIAKE